MPGGPARGITDCSVEGPRIRVHSGMYRASVTADDRSISTGIDKSSAFRHTAHSAPLQTHDNKNEYPPRPTPQAFDAGRVPWLSGWLTDSSLGWLYDHLTG
eukprot:GHVU01160780.1.p2 GENE.GHVU01160780.1~~GHVU01160780.1.p2  ORF type:complete len:101 (-),score=0.65 GHVU01160780.1:420-722(-)